MTSKLNLYSNQILQFINREIASVKQLGRTLNETSIQSLIKSGNAFKGTLDFRSNQFFFSYHNDENPRTAHKRPQAPRHDTPYLLVYIKRGTLRYYKDIFCDSSIVQLCRTSRRSTNRHIEITGLNLDQVGDFRNKVSYLIPSHDNLILLINLKMMLEMQDSLAVLNHVPKQIIHTKTFSRDLSIDYQALTQQSTLLLGPPGCGKTYTIAQVLIEATQARKKVLVCAFTNAALSALCSQDILSRLLRRHKIKKWALSPNEQKRFPTLRAPKSEVLAEGEVHLMTTFKLSQIWQKYIDMVDLIILDEAGQVFLPIFEMITRLSVPFLAVGDPQQLPAITEGTYEDVLNQRIIKGFETLIYSDNPYHRVEFRTTYRLSTRAAEYTSLFYDFSLVANQHQTFNANILGHSIEGDGPVLVLIDEGTHLQTTQSILTSLPYNTESIGIISTQTSLTRELQNHITVQDLFIDTVYRSQGHTFDYVIFCMPEASINDMRENLFNVATSRSRKFTFIITNHSSGYEHSFSLSRQYLNKLKREDSHVITHVSDLSQRVTDSHSSSLYHSKSRGSRISKRTTSIQNKQSATPTASKKLPDLPFSFRRKS